MFLSGELTHHSVVSDSSVLSFHLSGRLLVRPVVRITPVFCDNQTSITSDLLLFKQQHTLQCVTYKCLPAFCNANRRLGRIHCPHHVCTSTNVTYKQKYIMMLSTPDIGLQESKRRYD